MFEINNKLTNQEEKINTSNTYIYNQQISLQQKISIHLYGVTSPIVNNITVHGDMNLATEMKNKLRYY